MTSWKDKISFLEASENSGHPVEFSGGHTIRFYPISVQKVFQLKKLAGPIGKAIASFTASTDSDVSSETQRFPGEDGGEVMKISSIDPELAKHRSAERQQAVTNLVDALLDKENAAIIGSIAIDSMREIFPRGDKSNPSPGEFLDSAAGDIPNLVKILGGVMEANKGAFGPLGGRVEEAMASISARVSERAGGTETVPDTETTPGPSSPTSASGSPREATPSAG